MKPPGHNRRAAIVPKGLAESVRSWLYRSLEVTARPGRITPMEGMRGFAVLLVFLVHHDELFNAYLVPNSLADSISRFGHRIGHSGVDLFFVLSGYLIYGHLLRSVPSYWSFLRKRIHRIYPTFLCVLFLYALLCHLFPARSKLPPTVSGEVRYLAANLLLLPGIMNIAPLVTVTWSLSYEMFFYLTIPLVMGIGRLRKWRPWMRVLAFILAIVVQSVAYQLGLTTRIRMNMFLGGMILYEMTDCHWFKGRLSAGGERVVMFAYVGTALGLGLSPSGPSGSQSGPMGQILWTSLWCIALPALVLFGIDFNGALRAVFSARPLRWLGNMSYSFFLIHGLALNAMALLMRRVVPVGTHSPALFLVMLALNISAAVGVSLILFLWVEKPCSLRTGSPAPIQRVFEKGSATTDGDRVSHPRKRPAKEGIEVA